MIKKRLVDTLALRLSTDNYMKCLVIQDQLITILYMSGMPTETQARQILMTKDTILSCYNLDVDELEFLKFTINYNGYLKWKI